MDSNNHVAYSKEHIRFAVLSFFLAQGLCFSSWASRIPDIKEIFTVNDALYWGIVLFMIPVGKFVAIPLAGYLVSKLGSRIMVQISIMGYALSLFAIGTALNIYMLGVFLFCFGVFWNLCDIVEYTGDRDRAALWADDHGFFPWRMESGCLSGGVDRFYHDRFGCYSVLAFYVDSCIDTVAYHGEPQVFAG